MSGALQLVRDLSAQGFIMRPDGELLKLRPKSAVTDDVLEALRQHKAELLALLKGRCSVCMELEHQGVVTLICGTCGWQHPKVRVIVVLNDHDRLKAAEVARLTGLDQRVVKAQLRKLRDVGAVKMNLAGEFWPKERYRD